MIAFTKEQGPKIFESVDMVNVMTYDLMNRRDNATAHHTSMQGSLDVVNEYMNMGLHADKINLGFAYYAKWFTTDPDSDCDKHPLGCKVVKLEEDDGSDNGKSGALTFEASTVADPPKDLKETTNGKCGYAEGTKCPKGQCCSAYGNWYVQHLPNMTTNPHYGYTNERIVAPTTLSAKQAVSQTTAPARAYQSPTHGAARRKTARWTRRPAGSTTGTETTTSSGRGTRRRRLRLSSRTSSRPRSLVVLWRGVWVRIRTSLRISRRCRRGLSLPLRRSRILRRRLIKLRNSVDWMDLEALIF